MSETAVPDDLVEILRCPDDHSKLHRATPEQIDEINARIASGGLTNRGGDTVDEAIQAGLIREDGGWLYPVRDNTPIMLIDEAIPLTSGAAGD